MGFKRKSPLESSKRLSVRGRRGLRLLHANNWGPAQVDPNSNWRNNLSRESRHKIVNKIMDTFQRHMPRTDSDGMSELRKMALRFEEKIYTAAANQQDYLRKISLKMLSLETAAHCSAANSLPPNSPGGGNQKNLDPALTDALGQTGQSTIVDWEEKVYQRVNNGMDLNGNWRNNMSAESRQRIINKIMTVLQRHMPPTGSDGLSELKKIALQFEEKTYIAAASQNDYIKRISLKMLLLETKAQGFAMHPLAPNRPIGGN